MQNLLRLIANKTNAVFNIEKNTALQMLDEFLYNDVQINGTYEVKRNEISEKSLESEEDLSEDSNSTITYNDIWVKLSEEDKSKVFEYIRKYDIPNRHYTTKWDCIISMALANYLKKLII